MKDTIESLGIKEPISLGDIGSIFWSKSYLSGKGSPDDWSNLDDFERFCNQNWVQHYALPYRGRFMLSLLLNKPLRNDGFESVNFFVDWVMSTIEPKFNSEEGEISLERLAIPKELILCFKDILLENEGRELHYHYCCLPDEGDPKEISFEFVGCQKLTMGPDELLGCIAKRLSLALETRA